MAHYLVVAHQTATSPELRRRVQAILRDDPGAEFAVLLPAAQSGFHIIEDEEVAREESLRRAEEARAMLESAGAKVTRTQVGSSHPYDAIEDELREHPVYDALVICTLPAGISRWLRQDLPHKAEKFGLPVRHVVAEQQVGAHV